jgi:hypothetical protein
VEEKSGKDSESLLRSVFPEVLILLGVVDFAWSVADYSKADEVNTFEVTYMSNGCRFHVDCEYIGI